MRNAARRALSILAVYTLAGCTTVAPHPSLYQTPPVVPSPDARPSHATVGLVLTGGGAFGAWEVGALRAFFDYWSARFGEVPPICVAAGTSTGALIAPFALLAAGGDQNALGEVTRWYTGVRQADITSPKAGALLPFPLFAITTSSVYGVGYTEDAEPHRRLYGRIESAFPDSSLALLSAAWPIRRLAVATLDFSSGQPRIFTNSPSAVGLLRKGILASAMAPLAFPPIPIGAAANDVRKTPHLDGGVFAVAPLRALFDLAGESSPIILTNVVVISAFPAFPSIDTDSVQKDTFPDNPKFHAVGDRLNVLLSEAAATNDISLARAALALRSAGVGVEAVAAMTGFKIPGIAPRLTVLAPRSRLGWQALRFDPSEMSEMYQRGYEEASRQLRDQNPYVPTTVPSSQ